MCGACADHRAGYQHVLAAMRCPTSTDGVGGFFLRVTGSAEGTRRAAATLAAAARHRPHAPFTPSFSPVPEQQRAGSSEVAGLADGPSGGVFMVTMVPAAELGSSARVDMQRVDLDTDATAARWEGVLLGCRVVLSRGGRGGWRSAGLAGHCWVLSLASLCCLRVHQLWASPVPSSLANCAAM